MYVYGYTYICALLIHNTTIMYFRAKDLKELFKKAKGICFAYDYNVKFKVYGSAKAEVLDHGNRTGKYEDVIFHDDYAYSLSNGGGKCICIEKYNFIRYNYRVVNVESLTFKAVER